MSPKVEDKYGGISSQAVERATGKGWKEWFGILDKVGAKKLAHQAIAVYLWKERKLDGWWAQMVTVGYEQARGRRVKHQRPDGFEISVSKTLEIPLAKAYKLFEDDELRVKWLQKAPFEPTRTTPNKSMRFVWQGGETRGDVNFYPKGTAKCQVVVQHSKLADEKTAEKMKGFWKKKLEKLGKAVK